MKYLVVKILVAFLLIGAVFVLWPDSVQAQMKGGLGEGAVDPLIFKRSGKLLDNTLENTQAIAYGIAGVGVIGLGILAFFGQFKWQTFFMLIGGLVLISGAIYGILYITGADIGTDGIKITNGTSIGT